jgi:hypothetical protein
MVRFPRDAPIDTADHQSAARHFLGSLIDVGNLALCVGQVDWRALPGTSARCREAWVRTAYARMMSGANLDSLAIVP